ncbi:MAG: hypothetical protein KC613_17570 [Myxococcales bacterium]|nr:hypothetical protein [Myxococcales bacterium]MCB9522421.1 hypothetical protein [Myxococcales bacterium]
MKEQPVTSVVGLPQGLVYAGLSGAHPLFDTHAIRRAFGRVQAGQIDQRLMLSAHRALRSLAAYESVDAMRAFVRALPPPTVDLLIFLYFRHLDQHQSEARPTLH